MSLQATSGAASYDAFGGGVPVVPNYIEDVFSCFLYTGNGSTQTINNGIDLAGKGGLVWTKSRSLADPAFIYDTARGINNFLIPSSTQAAVPTSRALTSFNSNGFTLGDNDFSNDNIGETSVSWTFREAPKFFDVVTFTMPSSGTIVVNHNLGSDPGFITAKGTNGVTDWFTYHRSIGAGGYFTLNSTFGARFFAPVWNNVTATSFEATVGAGFNAGVTYVAYLFAHNAGGFGLTGTDNVISCGSFTGSATVNLGYEPQWVLVKTANSNGNWILLDTMRGWDNSVSDATINANTSGAEYTSEWGNPTATGFFYDGTGGIDYIYIAIRRGPMKVPTTGTSVFAPATRSGTGTSATVTSAVSPIDMLFSTNRDRVASSVNSFWDRLRGGGVYLNSNSTNAETSNTSVSGFDVQNGVTMQGSLITNGNSYPYVNYNFKRAPGFFDEVCYTGTGVAGLTINHNLTVAPELIINKKRSSAVVSDWEVSHSLGATTYSRIYLNKTDANFPVTPTYGVAGVPLFSKPTTIQMQFGVNSYVNASAETYVAYLFATCAGVSKVFSYTGNGSSQTINCGFTAGSRWVMIKRTDAAGDWYVWDSARGIVAGNDPHLSLNNTAAEVTTDDSVDTDNTGFIVNQVSATDVNVSSATYIGLAIA